MSYYEGLTTPVKRFFIRWYIYYWYKHFPRSLPIRNTIYPMAVYLKFPFFTFHSGVPR